MNQTKINALRHVISSRIDARLSELHAENNKGAAEVNAQRKAFIDEVIIASALKAATKELAPVIKGLEKLGCKTSLYINQSEFHRHDIRGTEEKLYFKLDFSEKDHGMHYAGVPRGASSLEVAVPQFQRDKLATIVYEPKHKLPNDNEVQAQIDLMVAEATLIDSNILEKVEEMVKRLIVSLKLGS